MAKFPELNCEIEFQTRFDLSDKDYFYVNSLIFHDPMKDKAVRFVDLYSLYGYVHGYNFDYSSPFVMKEIYRYLKYQNNVELINVLSRKLNGYNYFEIYDKSKKTKEFSVDELTNDFEHGYLPEHTFNEKCLRKNGKVVSMISYYRNITIPNYIRINLNEFRFYPIMYMNHNPFGKEHTKEFICHFKVLCHILSKIFPSFRYRLLSLHSKIKIDPAPEFPAKRRNDRETLSTYGDIPNNNHNPVTEVGPRDRLLQVLLECLDAPEMRYTHRHKFRR